MNLNNIGNNLYMTNAMSKFDGMNKSTDAKKKTASSESKNADVIYETSKNEETTSTKKNNKVDPETIAKLKADAEERLSQLKGIVEQLITKQGNTAQNANIWNQFRQGVLDGSIKVDEATAEQAAKDISEDGYWGIKQTSERIIDFAKALAGNDPSKAEDMRKAIQKGFDAAEKLWGDELPEISKKTHDAVMKGIDEWIKGPEDSEDSDDSEENDD